MARTALKDAHPISTCNWLVAADDVSALESNEEWVAVGRAHVEQVHARIREEKKHADAQRRRRQVETRVLADARKVFQRTTMSDADVAGLFNLSDTSVVLHRPVKGWNATFVAQLLKSPRPWMASDTDAVRLDPARARERTTKCKVGPLNRTEPR